MHSTQKFHLFIKYKTTKFQVGREPVYLKETRKSKKTPAFSKGLVERVPTFPPAPHSEKSRIRRKSPIHEKKGKKHIFSGDGDHLLLLKPSGRS